MDEKSANKLYGFTKRVSVETGEYVFYTPWDLGDCFHGQKCGTLCKMFVFISAMRLHNWPTFVNLYTFLARTRIHDYIPVLIEWMLCTLCCRAELQKDRVIFSHKLPMFTQSHFILVTKLFTYTIKLNIKINIFYFNALHFPLLYSFIMCSVWVKK